MSILQITDLTHGFGDKTLYQDASLSLHKGEHMGIVGQNGTGKTTLLNILLGSVVPTGGRIAWQSGVDIGHLDQYAQVDGTLTIAAYLHTAFDALYALERELMLLYDQMNADTTEKQLKKAAGCQQALEEGGYYSIDENIARIAEGLGLPDIGMDRQLETLSGGQRAKVILAKLLLRNPDVLLLDEPTNFLDAEHIAWLTQFLIAFPGNFMIVSHDFAFLDAITNCICDIEFQAITKYHGRYQAFVKQKKHLREEYIRRYEAQQREVERLTDYIARNKARAATARMAQSRQKKLDKMALLEKSTVLPKPNIVFTSLPLASSEALAVEKLRVGYGFPLLPPISFTIAGGQKVAITGFNGIGKSTLLKTLLGLLPPLEGGFTFVHSARIGYFEQDLHWDCGEYTPLQLLADAFPTLAPKQLRRELARYGLRAEHGMQPITTLSGGEQNRVKLCRLSMKPYNFLILDEPTNHLDAETKEALSESIAAFAGSVLLVSHEAAFYAPLVDRVIEIEKLGR